MSNYIWPTSRPISNDSSHSQPNLHPLSPEEFKKMLDFMADHVKPEVSSMPVANDTLHLLPELKAEDINQIR